MQASQALPSWLTLSSTVITGTDGSLSTSFDTLTLPLTYYGPPIPLGTDGTWVYGGLSSPAPTTASLTTPPPQSTPSPPAIPSTIPPTTSTEASTGLSSTVTPSTTSSTSDTSSTTATTPTSTPTLTSSPTPTSTSSESTSSSSALPTVPPVVPGGAGISNAAVGGIIGGTLGLLLLMTILLTVWLLRRHKQRLRDGTTPQSSSFWNRQTSIFTSNDPASSTPIWTGWDLVSPSEGQSDGPRTPGEGSPRHSGDEQDPFLTRRSIRSVTIAEEMAQHKTGTDTLVSVPAAVVVAGTGSPRPSPPRTGNIIPRDVISRMMDEGADEPSDIRIVEPSPQLEYSPLLPPPLLNPDVGFRFPRHISQRSLGSHNRSLESQRSLGDLEEAAELRVARRVRVSAVDPESTPGPSRNMLGLNNLSSRVSGRFAWLRRMSLTRRMSGSQPSTQSSTAPDSYTRSPTRTSHNRNASRSRPSSYVRFQDDPTPPPVPRLRTDSAAQRTASRPMSSVSGKSTSAASGNTAYFDAISTPSTDIPTVPEIPARFQTGGNGGGNGGSVGGGNGPSTSRNAEGSSREQSLSRAQGEPTRVTASGAYSSVPTEPPVAYDDSLPRHRAHTRTPSTVDILDVPAPAPITSFGTSREPPPNPHPIPNIWRGSHTSGDSTLAASGGFSIDIEDEPPSATAGWRTLSSTGAVGPGSSDGKRTTFGTPTVVQPVLSPMSEQGSLHSMRSHLSPYTSRSPPGSAQGSQSGSGSSRPSAHSHNRSLAPSSSVSDMEHGLHRYPIAEVVTPPLSAVATSGRTRDETWPSAPLLPPHARRSLFPPPSGDQGISPTPSRTPLLGGGEGTINSQTNSSITTALTDPITGAIMHFPSLPFRGATELDNEPRWVNEPIDEEEW